MKKEIQGIRSYGASDHYLGKKGEQYFESLVNFGEGNAIANLSIWIPYISETDSVLDFGCGNGNLLALLQCHLKVGVEINPVSRNYVKEHFKIHVFEDTSQADESVFTKIIVNHVLEHIPNPYNALEELRRIIKPEGLILILLPLEEWRAPGERLFVKNDIDQHLYTWTPKLLGNLLFQTGFEPLELRIITQTPPGKYTKSLLKLPSPIFKLISTLVAIVKRRRQLFAVARAIGD
jgi:SAM-dependent methyltransferase